MSDVMDLNADMGESPARLADGSDEELMRYITSANIACGGHAGDSATMETTLKLAAKYGVAAGAHPSFPDRENFGREELDMAMDDLEESVRSQIAVLCSIAKKVGVPVNHVKPHGALYHSCNTKPEVADAVARAVIAIDRLMIVVAQTKSAALAVYKEHGLQTAEEAFADRAYESDGTLRDRRKPGALLATAEDASKQAVAIALRGQVRTYEGSVVSVRAATLCMHSDTPDSAAIVKGVRQALEHAGVTVQRLPRP